MLQVVHEIHAPARRNFPRRSVDIRDLNETWQADIVDMSKYASENKGYKYLLTIIDNFSKYAFAVPVKSKSGKDVAEAFDSALRQGRRPKNLHVDMGKEFYNSTFESLMKKNNIHMYSSFSNKKASICERFNRTLKEKMWKMFSLRGKYKWIDKISELVSNYNNTVHRTIKMKPNQVTSKNAKDLYDEIYRKNSLRMRVKSKFRVGDYVRISKYKHVFEKGYQPNWTTEIFKISKVKNTFLVTYELKDYKDNPIKGCFYEFELLKTKHSNVYLVEKIVKRRGNKVFVKWLGFDDSHNSWIEKTDVMNE